ncbi:MAG: CesT family type III secretion system chaperone [Chlamydiales bacterium]|nr:CesT family type III secretion system chaperone [Chlamydiales bacterium]
MSYENAKANLKEFGKELNLENLAFDENNTCILGIDNTFSLHITYEPNSDRLYLYSPVLDGLPKDDKIRLKLYERLLEGSMLGGQMAGGGIGVATKEELVLMHCVLDMGLGAAVNALARFAALFVETVEKWREIVTKILAGEDPGPFQFPTPPGGARAPQPISQPSSGDKPGERYIKI